MTRELWTFSLLLFSPRHFLLFTLPIAEFILVLCSTNLISNELLFYFSFFSCRTVINYVNEDGKHVTEDRDLMTDVN